MITIKIIFLDIDGVLNNHDTLGLDTYVPKLDLGFKYMDHLSPWAVFLLNTVIESNTNTKVVISSSWRKILSIEKIVKVLEAYGFKGEVIGETPSSSKPNSRRGDDIQEWLDDNKHLNVESFVIIDDDSDMKHILHRLARINGENGIRQKDVKIINKILSNNRLFILKNFSKNKLRRAYGKIMHKCFNKWRY